MKKKRLLSLVCCVCLAILLIAVPNAVSAKTNEIKIGVILPLVDFMGAEIKKCYELLTEQLNEAGGLEIKGKRYKIKLMSNDCKFNPEIARAAAEKLVFKEKVKYIIGEYASICALAILEVTEPNKVIFFHSGASDRLFNPRFKYCISPVGDGVGNVMRTYYKVKKMLPMDPAGKKAVWCGYDDEGGHFSVGLSVKALKYAGVDVETIFFKRGTTDYSPVATKVKSLNPALWGTTGITSKADYLRLCTAVFQSGWKGVWFNDMHGTTVMPRLAKTVGNEAIEGSVGGFDDPSEVPGVSKEMLDFRRAYEAKYGEWHYEGPSWWHGWYFLIQAMQAANSLDPDDIMAVMGPDLHLESPSYGVAKLIRRPDVGVERYCDIVQDQFFGVVRDGKVVYHSTVTADQWIDMAERVYGIKFR